LNGYELCVSLHTSLLLNFPAKPHSARTAFDSLRQIHKEDSQLLKDLEVYVDGGFRRGTDVLAALCLGAKGVGFGRNFLWGQAAYGEQGVIRTIRS
jgi:L-lactate dehydrogenase (cytochrome)